MNALAPRVVVEAAAAEKVRRVVVTSSVAGIGPGPPGGPAPRTTYRGGGLGLTYPDAKHEGEAEALAAGARLGLEVVVVNPSYVFGPALDREAPGETSTRMIGNYLRGGLPAIVDGETNVVDVRDVAKGHVLAAERGKPGERYVLGGHDSAGSSCSSAWPSCPGCATRWPCCCPRRATSRALEEVGLPLPVSAEGFVLMSANWRYSSRKARGELGYRARPLDRTLEDTIDWYRELIDSGRLGGGSPSPPRWPRSGMRLAGRAGLLARCGRRAARRPEASGAVSVFPRDEYYMRLALREAERALEHDDVPIGAVVVHGEVIAAARNERELRGDPTAHAEILALREASTALSGWRLLDTVLYVTLEPCAMCAGAIVLARVPPRVGGRRPEGRGRERQ